MTFLSRITLLATPVLALTACATGSGGPTSNPTADPTASLVLEGRLTYQARIALPPDTEAVVELRASSQPGARPVASTRWELQGAQVPLPFRLAVDPAEIPAGASPVLVGTLLQSGLPRWRTDPVPVGASAAGRRNLGTLTLNPYRPRPTVRAFRCGDAQVSLATTDDLAELVVNGVRFPLGPVPAASGARYEGLENPAVVFWNQGERALLALPGQEFPECTALLTGAAPFRARGQEPGWLLELEGLRLALSLDYGETRLTAPLPAPRVDAGTGAQVYETRAGDQPITVTVRNQGCTDAMSGLPYPRSVTLRVGDRTLEGCGGEPAELLQGPEWVVTRIDGAAVLEQPRATLNFGSDGRVAGRGSCNAYSGSYTLTGEGLTIGQTASTMMACLGPAAEQEQRFFEVLGAVRTFEVTADGTLRLRTPEGRTLEARRP